MFLLNFKAPLWSIAKAEFTIQNVSIKYCYLFFENVEKFDLQYKMFLLNIKVKI